MSRSSSWCSLRTLGPVRRCALLLRGGVGLDGEPLCAWCGVGLTQATAEIDHVVPRRDGGGHDNGNLVGSCPDCNLDRLQVVDVGWLLAMPVDLAAGRALALTWYPWLAARLERSKMAKRRARGREVLPPPSETPGARKMRERRERQRREREQAVRDGLGGVAFPFGAG